MDLNWNIIKQFPPAWENNSRDLIRGMLKKFERQPSDRLAQQIEQFTGEHPDWSDNDWGNGPRGGEKYESK